MPTQQTRCGSWRLGWATLRGMAAGGQVDAWANVTATVGNPLSHRNTTRHEVEKSEDALSGVLRTM